MLEAGRVSGRLTRIIHIGRGAADLCGDLTSTLADDDALQRSAQVGALLVEKVVEIIQEMRSINIVTRVLTPGVNQNRAPYELDQRGCCLSDVDISGR